MPDFAVSDFFDYNTSVNEILDAVNAGNILARQDKILLKPNLVVASPFPITTHPDLVRAVIHYIRQHSDAALIIGEGCGDTSCETMDVFKKLGYIDLANELGVELLDLNTAPLVKLEKDCPVFPVMYLPEIAFSHFIISLPVLKAHSFSTITGTLKNMMGFAPPKYYSGRFGSWKKAVFHGKIHQAIVDLNRYRKPNFTLMDAGVGLADFHLGGPECNPPVKKLVAGYDPVQVDRTAAELLGFQWQSIPHLKNQI